MVAGGSARSSGGVAGGACVPAGAGWQEDCLAGTLGWLAGSLGVCHSIS